MRRYGYAFVAAMAAVGAVSPAMAITVADTGASANPTTYYGVGSMQTIFGRFTANVNSITSIEGYFLNESGSTRTVTATIFDIAGGAPNQSVGSADFTVPSLAFVNSWYGASGLAISLVQGSDYFVGFSSGAISGLAMGSGAPNPLAEYGNIDPSNPSQFGYRSNPLNVSVRISGENVAAAVPEPATWAMMIVGFGLIGAAVRRRPQAALA